MPTLATSSVVIAAYPAAITGHDERMIKKSLDLGQKLGVNHQLSDAMGMVFLKRIAFAPFAQAVDVYLGALWTDTPRDL